MALLLNNPTLKRLVFDGIIEYIERGEANIDTLLTLGWPADLIDDLRHRPARDLQELSRLSSINIGFVFEPIVIRNELLQLERRREIHKMQEYFIKNGASRKLLAELFRMSVEQINAYRTSLCPERKRGRSKLPPDDIRDNVHQVWAKLEKNGATKISQIYQLHQQFQEYSIEALMQTLAEFDVRTA